MSDSDSAIVDTPFKEAIAVKIIGTEGNTTILTGNAPWDWSNRGTAYGGFVSSLIFSATRTYFLTSHPSNPKLDPINSYVQYLHSLAPGPVRLVLKPIKHGSRLSIVSVEVQREEDDGSFTTCVLAIITQGNLATEKGLTIKTEPAVRKEDMPDRERDCVAYRMPDPILQVAPAIGKIDGWAVKGGKYGLMVPWKGLRNVGEGWIGRADGEDHDVLFMGFISDSFKAGPSNYSPMFRDLASGVNYPTICLSMEIKKNPNGKRWLYQRARCHQIQNGRYDMDVYLYDEGGDLVALIKQTSLVAVLTEGKLKDNPDELRKLFKL